MGLLTTPAVVRVPATSANLGPGFDALGLALGLHDHLRARVTDGGITVSVTGEGADDLPTDEKHLVVQTMLRTFELLGEKPPGLALDCRNRIPQARGLGSSSSAIVAGVLLARALVAPGEGSPLDDDEAVLRLVAGIEGHPDNAAPCLLGSFTIAWSPEGGARAVHVDPHPDVRPFVFVPAERGLTEVARAALPPVVPHRDASFNAGRSALLVHALTREPALLFDATEDKLHQGYRAAGMPGTAGLVRQLREDGNAAVVSGAGPTVLVLGGRHWAPPVVEGWRVAALDVDSRGASLLDAGTWDMLETAERDPVAAGWMS